MRRTVKGVRLVFAACALAWPGGLILAADDPSAEQINQWIRDLNHDRFQARQTATRNLIQAGRPAIGSLRTAATSSRPEVAMRAIRALGELLTSVDRLTSAEAKKTLIALANSNSSDVASRAVSALRAPMMKVVAELEKGNASVQFNDGDSISVNLDNAKNLAPLLRLLHELPNVTYVSISNSKMDDAAMVQLKGLPKLNYLNLFQSSIGDESLKILKTLPSLRQVPMGQTKVTDAGLVHLKDLTQLEYVGLRFNNVTDAGLVHLKKLTKLTGLNLGETKVTDAGLEELKGLTNLKELYLSKTKVTAEGVEKLRESIPRLRVNLD